MNDDEWFIDPMSEVIQERERKQQLNILAKNKERLDLELAKAMQMMGTAQYRKKI